MTVCERRGKEIEARDELEGCSALLPSTTCQLQQKAKETAEANRKRRNGFNTGHDGFYLHSVVELYM